MPELSEITSPVEGPVCRATQMPNQAGMRNHAATVAWWSIKAVRPIHPVLTQWMLSAVRLADFPDMPPAVLHFDGATHEVGLVALDPDQEFTPEAVLQPGWYPKMLQPLNLCHQFTATDEEMELVLRGMAYAMAHGVMPPEPWLGYESFREAWLESIVKTLAHIRGEVHAP